jgi:hypothetical protein
MKKLVPLALLALATTVCVVAQQTSNSSENVADAARKQHANDSSAPSHKVWTNDDFADHPAAAAPATGTSSNAPADATAATTGTQKAGDAKDKDKAKADAPTDQEKIDAEWKSKIDAEKAKIADLQREYDLTDRETRLAATTYYADAGNRLRDQKDFADKEAASRDKLATLKQQIADEKTKLSELQEQAHKAGANKAYD